MVTEITARHESAHGIIARLNGAHVLDCKVVDHFLNRNSGGICRWLPLHSENGHMSKVHLLTDMAIIIAGPLAVKIFSPASFMMCGNVGLNDHDLREFHRLAVQYTFGDSDGQRITDTGSASPEAWTLPILGEVWGATELELKANWAAVEAVAGLLLRFGEITQDQIDHAIKKAGGRKSTVDYLLENGSAEERQAAKKVRRDQLRARSGPKEHSLGAKLTF